MSIQGFVAGIVGGIAVITATVTGMPIAAANSCSISCQHSSCNVHAKNKKVYCSCNDGWAVCRTGSSLSKKDLVMNYASEKQLNSLEEYIMRAYDLGLYSVGDAASAMYEGLVMGNSKLYDRGVDDLTMTLDAMNDEDRALLDESE